MCPFQHGDCLAKREVKETRVVANCQAHLAQEPMPSMAGLVAKTSICLLVIASVLPLLPVGSWMVRLFDFPRIQLVVLLLVPITALVCWWRQDGWNLEVSAVALLCCAVLAWQLSHVVKYTPVWPPEVPDCPATGNDMVTVTVANLDFENRRKADVRAQLENQDSDLLLLIEFDEAWSEALVQLESRYPYREGVVRGGGLGIMLLSKLPFLESEVRHLVSDKRASVFTVVQPTNKPRINVVGLHPTPPGLPDDDGTGRHDSRIRDAELMILAKIISSRSDEKWVVTGDFNDVAWSHTSRVFKRISGLKDPRVGRGLYNTYHAANPIIRFPIDQIFLSPGATVAALKRFRPTGSDHFAITTTFAISGLESTDPQPVRDDWQDAQQMIDEGQEEAEERGDAPKAQTDA